MLKNLPIIPSQIFTHYTFLIPIAIPIIPFLFYCVNDNITIQEWLYIIYYSQLYLLTDFNNRMFDCSIRVSWSFAN